MDNKNLFDILIKEEKTDNNNEYRVKYSNEEIEKIMKINSADLKRYSGLINYIKYIDNNSSNNNCCSCIPILRNNNNYNNRIIPLPNLSEILHEVSNDYSIMLKCIIDNKEEGEVEINEVSNNNSLYEDDSIILLKLCKSFGYSNIKVKGKRISFK